MKITPTDSQKKMLSYLLAAGLSIPAAISSVFLIAPNEGKVNHTYVDPVGVITACWGHTDPSLKLGQKFTDEQCFGMLLKDSGESEKDVDAIIHVPLNNYQKAALISFDYNEGPTKLKSSTMAKLFNSGDYYDGCNELIKWVYAGKRKLPGLVERRNQELQFCLGSVEIDGE